MQTFLPYSDFEKSAKCLDNKRLNKQKVEAYQLCKIINGTTTKGWKNHPATLQWKDNYFWLLKYAIAICEECKIRGIKDNAKLQDFFENELKNVEESKSPWWLGFKDYHSSHRSNLLRKNYEFYSKNNWKETPNDPYVWPSKHSYELKFR